MSHPKGYLTTVSDVSTLVGSGTAAAVVFFFFPCLSCAHLSQAALATNGVLAPCRAAAVVTGLVIHFPWS